MLHIASMLGRRFGILMYDDFVLPLGYRMVERFNMMHKVVGWRTCGFELPDIIANRDKVVGTVRRPGARAGQARCRRDPADGHYAVPGSHQARLADAGARRAGGRRHRRADQACRHAGQPQARTTAASYWPKSTLFEENSRESRLAAGRPCAMLSESDGHRSLVHGRRHGDVSSHNAHWRRARGSVAARARAFDYVKVESDPGSHAMTVAPSIVGDIIERNAALFPNKTALRSKASA